MRNNALWSIPTGSLGKYVECVLLLSNLRCFEIHFFRNPETFTIYCSHVFQKFITLRRFIYRLFRMWYGFTVDEICGLQLVSLPYPQTSQSLTLVYHSSHILCIEEVYKLRVTFGVELSLKRSFYIQNIPK